MLLVRGTLLLVAMLLALDTVVPAPSRAEDYKPVERRRIFLMRHGDVSYFDEQGKPVADSTQVRLNDKGKAQADAAGRWFATLGIKRFDRVLTSNLPRTVETAERVLAAGQITGEPQQVAELREITGGRLPPGTDLASAWLAFAQARVAPETRFLGGESAAELQQRVFAAVDRLLADQGWDTALLVLHGIVNNTVISRALTGTTDYFGHFEASAGCVHILDAGPSWNDWIVQGFNLCPDAAGYAGERLSVLEKLLLQAQKARRQ